MGPRWLLPFGRLMPPVLVLFLLLVLAAGMAAAAEPGQPQQQQQRDEAEAAAITHAWPTVYKVGNAQRGHPGLSLRGEHFTVYSRAMFTKYGEVYNARQAPIPLPSEIVERFRGKVIGA